MTRFCFAVLFSLFVEGCTNDSVPSRKFVGAWVPYEIVFSDSTIEEGPYTGRSTFGFYAESLILNNDETYTPLIWENKSNYSIRTGEGGNFHYNIRNNMIILRETFSELDYKMEFVVVKYTSDELWLFTTDAPSIYTSPQTLYKLKLVDL